MGVASIQFGIPKRMFLAAIPTRLTGVSVIGEKPNEFEEETPNILRYGVFINPEIVATTGDIQYMSESCISLIPKKLCFVPRYREIKVKYQTLGSNEVKYGRLQGKYARVFQHEYDHLEGILVTDRHVDPKTVVKNRAQLDIVEKEISDWEASGSNNQEHQ
jgi:peptide deformylase